MTDTNQKLREAFEARMTDNGKWPNAITKGRNGCYLLAQTENAWSEWKACAELIATSAQQDWAEATGLEVINCPNCGDLARSANPRQALALPTAAQVDDINVAESFTSVTKTAAPDMPLSMNQFGRLVELTREHLTDNTFVYKATSKAGDTCHFGVESAAKAWAKGGTVEAIKVREFKLHTSSPTAAPVGELPELPLPTSIPGFYDIEARKRCVYTADQMRAYARSALSAGDAVDAQRYRWLREQSDDDFAFAVVKNPHFDVYESPEELDAAIDAAMRKGQG